ncbi:MAG: NAD(P)H-dependent oxidoreductase [Bacillota bacterium]
MLVVWVSGSPRVESNSEILLRGVLEGAAAAGASVELVRLRQLRFSHLPRVWVVP